MSQMSVALPVPLPGGSGQSIPKQNDSSLLKPKGGTGASGGKSFLKAAGVSYRTPGQQTQTRRTQGTNNPTGGSRSRVTGKKHDKARVMLNGRDVTPKPLGVSMVPEAGSRGPQISMGIHMSGIGLDNQLQLNTNAAGLRSQNNVDTEEPPLEAPLETRDEAVGPDGEGDGPLDTAAFLVSMEDDEELEEEDLDTKWTVSITETETFMLLEIPSTQVSSENEPLHKQVTESNRLYHQLQEDHKTRDIFVSRSAQTFNESSREKEVQASPPPTADAAVGVTTWDLFDVFNESTEDAANGIDGLLAAQQNTEPGVQRITTVLMPASESSKGGAMGSNAGLSSSINQAHGSFIGGASGATATRTGRSAIDGAGQAPEQQLAVSSEVFNPPSQWDKVSALPSFREALRVMERAICQTEMHAQQLLYRNFTSRLPTLHRDPTVAQEPQAQDSEDKNNAEAALFGGMGMGYTPFAIGQSATATNADHHAHENSEALAAIPSAPQLVRLWSYQCPLTKGRSVTCLDWNRQNRDLLAVGYGKLDFGNDAEGLILFWSLQNPNYPEKILRLPHSVTALDFCSDAPHLFAVGMHNGSVALYDIREKEDKPYVESTHATGKHSEPVWALKWVEKNSSEEGQKLISISSDGSVFQWSMKKGLVPHEIMQLKRVPNQAKFQDTGVDAVSRQASGLCFDFPLNDSGQYLAGTEDGIIHKCSVSYNEQTLDNFYGHTGPVYKLRCSPFVPDIFVSCSADWTAMLWSQKTTKPVLTLQSGKDYVMDVRWSPTNSCVFATACRDGRIEIWNLEDSTLDPVVRFRNAEAKTMTSLLFSMNSPVLLAGGDDGVVEVFRVEGVDLSSSLTTHQQSQRLMDAVYETVANEAAAAKPGARANSNGPAIATDE